MLVRRRYRGAREKSSGPVGDPAFKEARESRYRANRAPLPRTVGRILSRRSTMDTQVEASRSTLAKNGSSFGSRADPGSMNWLPRQIQRHFVVPLWLESAGSLLICTLGKCEPRSPLNSGICLARKNGRRWAARSPHRPHERARHDILGARNSSCRQRARGRAVGRAAGFILPASGRVARRSFAGR